MSSKKQFEEIKEDPKIHSQDKDAAYYCKDLSYIDRLLPDIKIPIADLKQDKMQVNSWENFIS